MGFVQTAFLGALAALAIPIIVHLIFRMRTRRVDLGSVRFLREVLHKNARRKRIKRLLLLALRMSAVALLALLFARPYFVEQGRGGSSQFVALLIDRSASMQLRGSSGERLIDQAVDRARETIQQAGKNARIELALFDHTVRPAGADAGAATPASDVLAGLISQEASFCATDYGAAFSWARDVCVRAGGASKQLHVFTDLQRSGLDWSEVEAMPGDVRVQIHDLGRDSANNVAVTAADCTRTLIRPGDTASVRVSVSNAGPFPLKEVPLRLYLRSERRTYSKEQKISLAAGGLEQFEFDIEGLEIGLWQGQVEIEIEDELRFDNRRFLALMSAPPWKVLIVNGQPHPSPVLSETYFLEAALRLAPPGEAYDHTPYEPKVIDPASLSGELAAAREVDIVILANVAGLPDRDAQGLADFVAAGGGLIVFSGENVAAATYRALDAAGLTPGQLAGIQQSDDLPWRLEAWQDEHPLFAPFHDPQHGDLRRLAFYAYTRVKPSRQVQVLARFRGGDPALLQWTKGQGRALWFASACDRQWSDWPRSRLYLPLIHQMLGHLTGLNEGGPVRGSTIDASSRLAGDVKPGVYQRAGYWEVVNTSARESETDRCTPAEFADRFDLRLGDRDAPAESNVAAVAPATLEMRGDEVWHWMALALLGVLCVECFLANRTTA